MHVFLAKIKLKTTCSNLSFLSLNLKNLQKQPYNNYDCNTAGVNPIQKSQECLGMLLLRVFVTKHHYFSLSKYLLGYIEKTKNKQAPYCCF